MKAYLLLIIGIIALAAITSGCTDTGSSTMDSGTEDEGADVPEGSDASANDTLSFESITSVYTEDNNTSTIRTLKGDTLVISLEENPTTGYSWNISASPGLSMVDDEYVQDPVGEGIVGAGGVHNWTFEVVEEGIQNISAVYKRPWEDVTGSEKTFELNVDVVSQENLIRTTGTVVYMNLEGGFYGIAGDDNVNYDPLNLKEEFREDGLEVEFTAYPAEDMASFHMWGQIVEIRSIKAVSRS